MSSMVYLFSGLNYRVFVKRSRASLGQFCSHSFLLIGFIFDSKSSISFPKFVLKALISERDGGPVHVRTLSIWLRVELPGKKGLPFIIYPSMQPKLHTSIAFVYLLEPNKISGARYHLVAIYSVRMGLTSVSSSTERTSPKSQILAMQSSFTRTLDGLISRWTRSAECK